MTINVLILAAGQSLTEPEHGGYPVCLAEFDGLSLLERIVGNTRRIEDANYAFAFQKKEADRFHLDKVVQLLTPGATVFRIPESTQGSACTALLAACQLPGENELLIISANELVDIDFSEVLDDFQCRKLDAGTLIFRSIHPRYSYVRLDSEGIVTEATQQNPISQHATVGVFWFSRTTAFVDAAKNLIRKNACTNDKFFVAPTFNELILHQARVGVREMENGKYRPLKTERQIHQFEQGGNG